MILVWNNVGMEYPCPPLLPPPSVWGPAISCLMTLNGIWLHWLILFVLSVATANRYRWYWTGLCNTLLKVRFAQFTLSMCRYKCVGQVIVTCNSGVKWRTKWPLHNCGQSLSHHRHWDCYYFCHIATSCSSTRVCCVYSHRSYVRMYIHTYTRMYIHCTYATVTHEVRLPTVLCLLWLKETCSYTGASVCCLSHQFDLLSQ